MAGLAERLSVDHGWPQRTDCMGFGSGIVCGALPIAVLTGSRNWTRLFSPRLRLDAAQVPSKSVGWPVGISSASCTIVVVRGLAGRTTDRRHGREGGPVQRAFRRTGIRIRSYANCVRVDRDRGKVDFPCLVAAVRTGYGTRTHPVADELMDCSGIGAHWLTDAVPVVEACVQIGCVQISWAGNGNRVTTCTRWPRSWPRRTATRGFRSAPGYPPPPGPSRPATPAKHQGCPRAVPVYGVQ